MQATSSHTFADVRDAKAFTLAGNAIITLQSLKTGVHYTYKVTAAKVDPESTRTPDPLWFVKLLTSGSADEGEFTYLGVIRANANGGSFTLTKKSCVTFSAPSAQAFSFFWSLKESHPALVVRHCGRCGRCGRTLTVPESIQAGIGPECQSKMEGGL